MLRPITCKGGITGTDLPRVQNKEKVYPCNECGKLRSKDEGGTVFTVCDECWMKWQISRSLGNE